MKHLKSYKIFESIDNFLLDCGDILLELKDNGFDVQFDGGVDYKDETQFDEYVNKNLDQVIEHIKDTRTITLKEVQVKQDLV